MKRVIIESPFASDTIEGVADNIKYALECLKSSIDAGESPFASHLFYPQVLNDGIREERVRGIVLGYHWMACADLVAVYTDLGISPGMKAAIDRAEQLSIPVEYRTIR